MFKHLQGYRPGQRLKANIKKYLGSQKTESGPKQESDTKENPNSRKGNTGETKGDRRKEPRKRRRRRQEKI